MNPTGADESGTKDSRANESVLSRRRLLQAAGVVAATAAAAGATKTTAAAEPMQPFRPRGRLRKRPNFLIIMVDEQRHAPVYESDRLKAWRAANLPSQNLIRRHGVDFTEHHIMAAACQPSRASIYTGQYPSLHGVSQTSGAAKTAIEQDLYWLDPATVPTLGNWFRAGGYDTFWKGKWHVSDADLYQPGSYQPIPSYTDQGFRDPYLEELYIESERLEQYGFNGFVGPEPHGSNPLNSGSSGPSGRGRDAAYAQMGVEQLKKLRNADKPWLLVTSFVNPHDITLWGDLSVASDLAGNAGAFYLTQQLQGSNVPADLFTDLYAQSANEDMSTKPSAQESYVGQYPKAFQPLRNGIEYHRFYYQLQKEVDKHIGQVMAALMSESNQYRDTIVIYLSDHGEMLGSHGGMFQKWHNAYDEVLKVPMVFHNPQLFPEARSSEILTSHADLIPTMLGLAGLDQKLLAKSLRETHSEVRELVGRDLSGYLLGEEDDLDYESDPVFFMTDDQPFKGASAVSVLGNSYQPVVQPNCVETVVTYLPTGPKGEKQRWKYSRYWDNPQFWTSPGVQDVQTYIPGQVNQPGTKTAITTVKAINPTAGQNPPEPDQYELYNVTEDPAELTNLYGNATYSYQLALLQKLLDAQVRAKRLSPIQQPWADGSAQQFPFTPS